jgi:hypothetical protein
LTVRPYDPERNPPVIVSQWQRFPPSPERGFAIAAGLGQFLDADGGAAARRRARDWYGSLISPRRLPVVLEAIGVSDRTWRRYTALWESLYLAHRCGQLQVCLFTRPLPDRCPACQVELERDHVPARRPETDRDGKGRFTSNGGPLRSGVADRSGPIRGRKRSVEDVPGGRKRSATEHEHDAPHANGHNGREVGSESLSHEPSEEAASAVEELPRGRLQETAAGVVEWISPFEDKSCPECGCWPHQGDHFAGCSHRTTIQGMSA